MLSPRCCFYVAVASPGSGGALIARVIACLSCVACKGLFASRLAPTVGRREVLLELLERLKLRPK
ncbi:hypothetical protein ACW9HW_23245, partial [Pseudomonas sp. SDO5532_S415]